MNRAIELRPAYVADTAVRLIMNVAFDPNGLTVEFVQPADVKANGMMLGQSIFIPHARDYDDEIDAVHDAVQALLADVLEDFPCLPQREFDEDEDDDRGMGE